MSKVKLGFSSIVLLGINTVIGSGIFLLPNQVYAMSGTGGIWVIVVTAILVSSLAFCYAEACGWHSDKGGGTYIFAREAFGNFVGFEFGVLKYISITVGWAAVSNAFVISLSAIFPIFKEQPLYQIAVALFITMLVVINLLGLGSVKRILNILTVSKILPMIAVIIVGLFFVTPENIVIPSLPETVKQPSFAGAILVMAFAFLGFDNAAAVSEDMVDPKKNLPRALSFVLVFVSLVYISIYLVCLGVLGTSLGETQTPVADVALKVFGRFGGIILSVAIIISIAGINMALAYAIPRYLCAMSKDGHLPSVFLKTSKVTMPYVSIIATGLLTMFLALSGSFTFLIQLLSFTEIVQYLPVCFGIFLFRKKLPRRENQFILPLGPVIPIIAVGLSIWLLANSGAKQIIWGLSGFLFGLPFYAYRKYISKKI